MNFTYLQFWTKFVETKIKNLVNSRNGLIFQIPNSPPYPLMTVEADQFFIVKHPKLCEQHWFGGRGVFSLKNRFSLLSQQFFPRLWVEDIFWKICLKLLNGSEMYFGALDVLKSINSKLQKWFGWINARIQHQNMIFLKNNFNFTK